MSKQVTWVCDKCGKSEQVKEDQRELEMVEVTLFVPREEYIQEQQLCLTCFGYWAEEIKRTLVLVRS